MILPMLKIKLPGTTVTFNIEECFEFWSAPNFNDRNHLMHYHPDQHEQQTVCIDVFLHPERGYILKLLHHQYGIIYLPIKHHFKRNGDNIYIDGIRYKKWIRKMLKTTKCQTEN